MMTTTPIENHTLERLLDAWDTTVLPTHRDGAMQEWMEALRHEFTTCPDASITGRITGRITGLDPAPKAETDDRHAQELLAQDITIANMQARHAQELAAYELTVRNQRAEQDAEMKDAERMRDALRFYADGDHFTFDRNAWDTVSDEPQNFWCDEAETATVEDGTIAKLALSETKPADITTEMAAVADRFAHRLALDLECVLADYSGTWYETAMKTLGAYREAMNAIHERVSPTFMGEPLLPAIAKAEGRKE
jgi:hypothetical protein